MVIPDHTDHTDRLIRYCYFRIPTELWDLILKFREECYIQELIQECIEQYEAYRQQQDQAITLFHYYDVYVIRHFQTVIDTQYTVMQLIDILEMFKALHGRESVEYIQIQKRHNQSLKNINRFLNDDTLTFCTETIEQIQNYNRDPVTRKTFTVVLLLTFVEVFKENLVQPEVFEHIREHSRIRLEMLQFIIRWVCRYTIDSWKFWLTYYIQSHSHQEMYSFLQANRPAIEAFLKLRL
jgi:hypothetical protein